MRNIIPFTTVLALQPYTGPIERGMAFDHRSNLCRELNSEVVDLHGSQVTYARADGVLETRSVRAFRKMYRARRR